MPATLLALIAAFGWRYTYAGSAAFILIILLPGAIWLIRSDGKFRKVPAKSTGSTDTADANTTQSTESPSSTAQTDHPRLFKSLYVWFCMPMLAAPPMIMTALFFHQGAISTHKEIDLGWFAAGIYGFCHYIGFGCIWQWSAD